MSWICDDVTFWIIIGRKNCNSCLEAGRQIRVHFFIFSSKTYIVGTQKNRLNETVLMSTQNRCLN